MVENSFLKKPTSTTGLLESDSKSQKIKNKTEESQIRDKDEYTFGLYLGSNINLTSPTIKWTNYRPKKARSEKRSWNIPLRSSVQYPQYQKSDLTVPKQDIDHIPRKSDPFWPRCCHDHQKLPPHLSKKPFFGFRTPRTYSPRKWNHDENQPRNPRSTH